MIVKGKISARDLTKVIIIQTEDTLTEETKPVKLTQEDREWQEARRQRKVKRLSYEVR